MKVEEEGLGMKQNMTPSLLTSSVVNLQMAELESQSASTCARSFCGPDGWAINAFVTAMSLMLISRSGHP